ncbi:retrotransposon protein, putative, ty1-copia subclass, partial [Tanacetum coccineum]
MVIQGGRIQKANKKSLNANGKGKGKGKGKDKPVYIPKPENPKPFAKEHPTKDDACHHYKEVGHWKRNCPVYLDELIRRRSKLALPVLQCPEQLGLYLSVALSSCSYKQETATDLLGIIHTDVCGPLRYVSRQGASYFITFTDDYSRYGYVYLLKHKPEVCETFKVFKNEVENQLGKTIKALRSDRGSKYISQKFKDYLKVYGIVQHLTPRRNRTLLDIVRSMMNLITLPLSFWDYALEFAARILHMVSTKKVDKTPYELWYGKVPNLSYLKVWSCEALVKQDTPDKLHQRYVKCIFIGYPKEMMDYYFYFPP